MNGWFYFELGARQLHVYNREGLRQSTSEPVDGLEQALSWKYVAIL